MLTFVEECAVVKILYAVFYSFMEFSLRSFDMFYTYSWELKWLNVLAFNEYVDIQNYYIIQ